MRLFTDPWAHLRGRHHGETAFILGNGPSICREDLSRLRGRLSIGMNASTQLEAAHGFVGAALQALVEALQRVAPAFDMRVVRREQRHLGAGVGDDPARVLVRVGRDADLTLYELGGLE